MDGKIGTLTVGFTGTSDIDDLIRNMSGVLIGESIVFGYRRKMKWQGK